MSTQDWDLWAFVLALEASEGGGGEASVRVSFPHLMRWLPEVGWLRGPHCR